MVLSFFCWYDYVSLSIISFESLAINYFLFNLKHPVKRKIWLDACKILPSEVSIRICWKHFLITDFKNEITELNFELCNFGQLKKDVTPSQNLPDGYMPSEKENKKKGTTVC